MTEPGHTAQADPRIPVTLLTGYLGSGKSTVVNRLLADPAGNGLAIIVNEFGEVPIDHLLLAQGSDKIIELPNGCLCCALRSDLSSTLFGLYAGRVDGTVASFRHVVIETSGVAEPGPVLRLLYTDEAVARRFRVASVVTVVDSVHGLATLDEQAEAELQVFAADRVLVSKTDIAGRDSVLELEARLAALNPDAPRHRLPDPGFDLRLVLAERSTSRAPEHDASLQDHRGHVHPGDEDCHHEPHHARYAARAVVADDAIDWRTFAAWVDRLGRKADRRLLRIKGLVHIREKPDRPLVFQAVQGVGHPPAYLDAWPSGDRRTRLVFIQRGMSESELEDSLGPFGNTGSSMHDVRAGRR